MNSSDSSSIFRYSSNGGTSSNGNPFTVNQWQELEHQALIYKYLMSGIPVPSDLLFPLKRPSSYSSPLHMGWSCYHHQVLGRKIDPEPGRCRRTDGKKWRCSKEAFPDSKYCERHMHRGKNRSRKHVEQQHQQQQLISPNTTAATSSNANLARSSVHQLHSLVPSPSPETLHQLKSDYRYSSYGLKEGVIDERAFFSEPSGTARSFSGSSMEDAWQLTPLTISSSRQSDYSSYLQLQSIGDFSRQEIKPNHNHHQYFYALGGESNKYDIPMKLEDEHEPHKTIHRFFDEEPIRGRDSWLDQDEKSSSSSTTRLSISMPSSSSNDHLPLFGSRRD
ncbi:hypothetical protein SAY87_007022 [Trapa incisa]|uniref:Growth-regulating factor n=1 Tax=Trapa incisa TaxID=236973 RepID=A0AAN7K3E4_9MYRT|nr:hypothetical protein SAY87_007022 [Trapa incisa]